MARDNFWSGFALGALAGVGGLLAMKSFSSDKDSHILRLEKSVNIGRPVEMVFAAWSNFERLPQFIDFVKKVERYGTHSRWTVNIDGKEFEWDAQITQVVSNQSIGWKSLAGPRHTGRINFAPLGEQTVVHVIMNYAPPLGGLGSMLPIDQHLEDWIERGLREFKAALESSSPELRTGTSNETVRSNTGPIGVPGEHAAPGTVRYTRPPQDKY